MSPVERSATPVAPSTLLQESHPSLLSESSSPDSYSASSTEYPCCQLPPVPELSTPFKTDPPLDLSTSITLEEQFLNTLAIQPTVGSIVRAAAVVPQDRRAAGYHLLIDLLCHRMFSIFRDQRGIRNFSVYYYEQFLPGDNLNAVCRRVIRRQLSWLEATVARDSVIVATATTIYDAARLELEEGNSILAEMLFADFDGVHSSIASGDRDLCAIRYPR